MEVLGGGENGREDDAVMRLASVRRGTGQVTGSGPRCWMHDAAVVQVVLLECVARSCVHPGCPVGACRLAVGEDLCRAVSRPHLLGCRCEDGDGVCVSRGQG